MPAPISRPELRGALAIEEVADMKSRSEMFLDAIALSLGLAVGVLAFAQYDSLSASPSANKAGESLEHAGANTTDAIKHDIAARLPH